MRVEGREFSSLSDAELDDIAAVTPKAGLLTVQGSLRQQGLMVQRVRVMHSLPRVDPVTLIYRDIDISNVAHWNSRGVGGFRKKSLPWGVWIFSGITHCNKLIL